MPDEDFTSIEAALQVVEKFASRLTVGDAEGHVRRSVDELRAAVTKKEGLSQRSIGCCAAYEVWMTPMPPHVAAILGASRLRSIASLTPFRKSCCRR